MINGERLRSRAWRISYWIARSDARTGQRPLFDADAGSLRIREARGGARALTDDDEADIHKTIVDDVLKGEAIEFRSTEVEADDDRTLLGRALWLRQ